MGTTKYLSTLFVSFAPFVAFVAVAAQQPPQPAPQKLEARADLVLVDVTVVDNNGKPIPDLTAKDFDLRVNGQPRPIHTVQFISTVGMKSTPDEDSPRAANYSGNDGPSSGRLLLFAVDENHLRYGSATAVLRTIDLMMDAMAPGDYVGLARVPYGTGGVEPTTDRALIRRTLEKVTGRQSPKSMYNLRLHEAWAFESNNTNLWARVLERECGTEAVAFAGSPANPPGVSGGINPGGLNALACVRQVEAEAKGAIADAASRAQQSITALERLMTSMRSFRMPVTIVFISEGLFIARDRNDLTFFARRASDARVTLHAIQPGSSMFDHDKPEVLGAGFGDDPLLAEGLEMLAGYTRGTFHKIMQGTGKTVFERLSRELTGYYLLSFEPTDADRASKNRAIKVEVARRGITVRARSTYSLPDAPTDVANVAPEEQVKQLLIAPLPTAGLRMRVATYSVTNPQDNRVRVIVAAEIGDAATAPVEWPVGMLVLDKANNFVVNTIAPMKLTPASARPDAPQLLLTQMLLEPGEYTLRLAASTPDGRSGSVHHTIRAGLAPLGGADGLSASDFILSEATGTGLPPRPTPSAVIDSETLSAHLELAGDPQRLAKARVTVEISDKDNGTALLKADAQAGTRSSGAQRAFVAGLRIGLLPPGEYVARAIVTVPGQRDSMIVRPFRLAPTMAADAGAAHAPRGARDAEEIPIPTPRAQLMMPLPRFTPDEVLKPAVVRVFVDDLKKRFTLSQAATAVLDYASKGTFAAPPADGRTEDGDEPALAFVRGLAALQKKEIAQAAAWFQVTLRAASDYLGAAFYLGATHAMAGRDKDAVGAWQMALLSDASSVVYPVVVDGWLRAGDGQAALDLIAESPNAWPDAEARLRRVAVAQAMLGQFGPALETAGQVLQRRPEDLDMLLLAIQVLYRQHSDSPLTGAARARFEDYTARYEKAQGPQTALVQTWRKAVLR